jgi:tRNA (guanine-N7-)-methyltransferase
VRKPRRLSAEELAPYQWEMARTRRRESGDGGLESASCSDVGSTVFIDWSALFGNANPVEIEVGMGKGLFLLTSASGRPETNFFGIEIVRKYQLYATTRFAIRGLPNVKTVCADAKGLFTNFVPPDSVAAVHVYFPDPWWKARHRFRAKTRAAALWSN